MAIPFSEEDFAQENMMAGTGQPPADIIDQMAQVREEQARSLQEHLQYRAGLEQQQQQVEMRSGDLDVSERLMRVFDTTLPKPFREFELRGLSRHLGIDPKGDSFKDISKVVMGLDPDSSQAVKEAFVARMSEASPGQVSEFTRGILQGKVPISQLAGMVRETQVAQASIGGLSDAPTATGQQPGGTPPDGATHQGKVDALFQRQQGEFKPNDVITQQQAQGGQAGAVAGLEGNPPADLGNPLNTSVDQSATGSRDLSKIIVEGPAPVDNRVVDPSIASALGYDANKVPSAEILARHPGIGGLKLEDQQKKAKDLGEVRQFAQETVRLADKITGIVDSDPNTVSYTVPIIGRWGFGQNINTAREVTSINDAIKQFSETMAPKGWNDFVKKNFPEIVDESQVRETAKKSQEVLNSMIALAYMSAKAKDPAGRLSDQDLQLELRSLGADSGSADLLKTALASHVDATVGRYNAKVRTETGGDAVDIKAARPATIERQAAAATTTDPAQAAAATPAQSPTQTQAAPTENKTPAQQAQQSRSREQAKDADEEVQQKQRRWNLEQAPVEARLRLEAAQRDEARLQLAMDQAREQKEWREYQKLKDQKAEATRRREKISAAFAQFARAMSSAVRGGVGGGSMSMGPDQDANAFKIAPGTSAKRGPPSPGQAQGSHQYTYTGRRRASER